MMKKEAKAPEAKASVEEEKGAVKGDLKAVFTKFTGGKPEMDGKTFFKVFKDCGLLDKKLTQTVIDLAFAKCAEKGVKKMKFDQFKKGLAECAGKKGMPEQDLTAKITSTGGPEYKGTKADAVKLHDDKSSYTGVYAHGGPSTVDKDKITSISQTCDRTDADVRGTKK